MNAFRTWRGLWCLALLPAAATPLCAGELSLSQCLELGQTRSLQQVRAALQETRAKAVMDSAGSQRWPQVSVQAQYDTTTNLLVQQGPGVEGVFQAQENLIPFLSPAWIKAGQAAEEYKAAQTDRVATRQDVDLLVKRLYFSVLRDRDAVARMDRVTAEYRRLLDYLAPQFTVGKYPRFDKVKVKASLADLARNRALTLAQLAGEKSELAQVLGQGEEDLSLQALSALPGMPSSAGDLEANPTLQALAQRVRAARIGLDADGFARFPSLTADFGYGYSSPALNVPPDNNPLSHAWDLTLQVSLPIFDWGQIDAQAAQDRADWKLAQNELALRKQQVSSRWIRALASTRAYLDDYHRTHALLSDVEGASHAALRQYRRGAMGIVETTDAVDLWLQTDLNERNAYYSYLSGLADLQRLTGGKWRVDYE